MGKRGVRHMGEMGCQSKKRNSILVQTLHVLLHRDHVAQVVVDGSAEDWVVDNDPVYL